ncbi:hypothetical protein AURDEDRAFT_113020 [Auricularia subglabra TFB-10046 SS5]|nr:hypothetical protein AURDEDRAFT_113020 [Auricularia subglabra TFB-10046 SS5]
MLRILLFAALALALPSQLQLPLLAPPSSLAPNIALNDCGTDDDAFKLDSIVAEPYPPRAGENVTVTASGTVYRTIDEGAYVVVTVKLGLVKVVTQRVDICQQLRESSDDVQCPVEPGEYNVETVVPIPGVAPMGKYKIETRGYSADGLDEPDLTCVDIALQLRPVRPGHKN